MEGIRRNILHYCDINTLKNMCVIDKLSVEIVNDSNFWIDKFKTDDLLMFLSQKNGSEEWIKEYEKVSEAKNNARKILIVNRIEKLKDDSTSEAGSFRMLVHNVTNAFEILSMFPKYSSVKNEIYEYLAEIKSERVTFCIQFSSNKNGFYSTSAYFSTYYDSDHGFSCSVQANFDKEFVHYLIMNGLYFKFQIVDKYGNEFFNENNVYKYREYEEMKDCRHIICSTIDYLDIMSNNCNIKTLIIDINNEIINDLLFEYIKNIKITTSKINRFLYENGHFYIKKIFERCMDKHICGPKDTILPNPYYTTIFEEMDNEMIQTTHSLIKRIIIYDVLKHLGY